jgi:hypothetical protein
MLANAKSGRGAFVYSFRRDIISKIKVGSVNSHVVPKYTPIELIHPIKAVASDLIQLRWEKYAFAADFIIPDDNSVALRVEFDRVDVIRLLEEMPISTEHEETPNEGTIANHFAYLWRSFAMELAEKRTATTYHLAALKASCSLASSACESEVVKTLPPIPPSSFSTFSLSGEGLPMRTKRAEPPGTSVPANSFMKCWLIPTAASALPAAPVVAFRKIRAVSDPQKPGKTGL